MTLSPGTLLGPYQIVSPLGAGGMGEVYRARDTRLDRLVALKVLPPGLAGDPQFKARFDREARALSQVNHPHICALYDVGEQDGTAFLVMELLDGQTLAARLEKGALPLDEALQIASGIADALAVAHRHGIIHRDLKPANIMLVKAGTSAAVHPKLLDFGLAKRAVAAVSMGATSTQQTGGMELTDRGTILGTLHYMAPEQVEGREADARSDIWAFGTVLYEMLTGVRPFVGDSPASVLSSILKDTPPLISARRPVSPESLDRVVNVCLAKNPDERWQSFIDLKRELEWIRQSSRQTALVAGRGEAIAQADISLPASSAPAKRDSPSKPKRERRIPWFLVPITILALIFGSRLIPRRSSPLPTQAMPPVSATPAAARLEVNLPESVYLSPSYSPRVSFSADGRRLAMVGVRSGVRQLWVRSLDDFEAKPVPGTETVQVVALSPEGTRAAFVGVARILRIVSLADGLVSTVLNDVDFESGLAWSDDGRIVFGRRGELWDVSVTGGEPTRLTTLDAASKERLHAWPALLPEGDLLFTAISVDATVRTRIDRLIKRNGERRSVVANGRNPVYGRSGHLMFVRDGAVLAATFDHSTSQVGPEAVALRDVGFDQMGTPLVTLSPSGTLAYESAAATTRHLVWVSRQGIEEPVTDAVRPYQSPRLDSTHQRIVVENAGDIWVHDLGRQSFTRLTSGSTLGNGYPALSPDGSRIVFRTLFGMHVLSTDGGGAPVLLPGTGTGDFPTSVSPDGQRVIFIRQNVPTTSDIFETPLDGSGAPQPLLMTNTNEGGGMFSPDGRWFSYSMTEGGRYDVFARPYHGADKRIPVSARGGIQARWSPAGKELFYRDGDRMMVVDVRASANELVLSTPRVLFERRYSFGPGQSQPNYDVSADGQRFLMVKEDWPAGRLSVVLNWTEELRRLTSAPERR